MNDKERVGLRRGIAGQVAAGLAKGLPVHAAQVAAAACDVADAVIAELEKREAADATAREAAAAAEKLAKENAGKTEVEPH